MMKARGLKANYVSGLSRAILSYFAVTSRRCAVAHVANGRTYVCRERKNARVYHLITSLYV